MSRETFPRAMCAHCGGQEFERWRGSGLRCVDCHARHCPTCGALVLGDPRKDFCGAPCRAKHHRETTGAGVTLAALPEPEFRAMMRRILVLRERRRAEAAGEDPRPRGRYRQRWRIDR